MQKRQRIHCYERVRNSYRIIMMAELILTVGVKSMSPLDIELLFAMLYNIYRSGSQHKYFFY